MFLINENKNTQYLNNDYADVTKFTKIISNSSHNRQKTQNKSRKTKKTSFPKKKRVENADLYKPVLNKIVTVHK